MIIDFALIVILTFALLIMLIFWLVTDPRNWRARFEIKILIPYLLVSVVVLSSQLISGLLFPLNIREFDLFLIIAGTVLFVTGIALCIWAKLTMSKYWGPPGQHDYKRQNTLITWGPFAFSRNPIYLGWLMVCLGYAFTLRSSLFWLVAVLFLYFRNSAIKEESLLEKYFGKKYLKYKAKTPRFLFK